MFPGLQDITIQKVLIQPNSTTSCSRTQSDIATCLHNLHIHRSSHCFDNKLNTTCKTAGLEKYVKAISANFQREADVKSVTIYNPQTPFPHTPEIKVIRLAILDPYCVEAIHVCVISFWKPSQYFLDNCLLVSSQRNAPQTGFRVSDKRHRLSCYLGRAQRDNLSTTRREARYHS